MKRIILTMILLAFLLVGCRGFSRSQEGDVNYRRGTQGLEIRFLDRSPPHVLYETDPLVATLELYNRGASEIRDGYIYFTGFDTNIITQFGPGPEIGTRTWTTFRMDDKKTQFNREGGYDIVEFSSSSISLGGLPSYRIPLTAYACYDYETIASTEICVDPEPYKPPSEKPCQTRNVNFGGSQAAPVAVTYANIESMVNQVRITFTIKNVGNGMIVRRNSIERNCPTNFGPNDVDVVQLTHVTLGGRSVSLNDCSPSGEIRLSNGVGRVSCVITNIGADTAFTTPLEIKLDYGYRTHIRRDVEIRSIY